MFAVLVHHNTGHGEQGNLALLVEESDEGLKQAVECALNIGHLGYEFHGSDIGAQVVRMPFGTSVPKKRQEYVLIHRYYNRRWKVEWVDVQAQRRYEAMRQAV